MFSFFLCNTICFMRQDWFQSHIFTTERCQFSRGDWYWKCAFPTMCAAAKEEAVCLTDAQENWKESTKGIHQNFTRALEQKAEWMNWWLNGEAMMQKGRAVSHFSAVKHSVHPLIQHSPSCNLTVCLFNIYIHYRSVSFILLCPSDWLVLLLLDYSVQH